MVDSKKTKESVRTTGATAPKEDDIARIPSTRTVSQRIDRFPSVSTGLEYLGFNENTSKVFFIFFLMYCIVGTIVYGTVKTRSIGQLIGIEIILSFFLVLFRDRFFTELKNNWIYGIMNGIYFGLDVAGIVTFIVLHKYVDWDYFSEDTAGFLEYIWIRPGLAVGIFVIITLIITSIFLVGCKAKPLH